MNAFYGPKVPSLPVSGNFESRFRGNFREKNSRYKKKRDRLFQRSIRVADSIRPFNFFSQRDFLTKDKSTRTFKKLVSNSTKDVGKSRNECHPYELARGRVYLDSYQYDEMLVDMIVLPGFLSHIENPFNFATVVQIFIMSNIGHA